MKPTTLQVVAFGRANDRKWAVVKPLEDAPLYWGVVAEFDSLRLAVEGRRQMILRSAALEDKACVL